jgi:hypothetical protein
LILDFPTGIDPDSASLIDSFFLDGNAYNTFQVHPVLSGLSDHDGQILVLDNLQVMRHADCIRAYINEENSLFSMDI